MSDDSKPQVGDRVRWTTVGRGVRTEREGRVVHVVAAGRRPGPRWLKRLRDPGQARDVESYVVTEGRTSYWPRAVRLRDNCCKRCGGPNRPHSREVCDWIASGGGPLSADIEEQYRDAIDEKNRA